MIAIQTKYIGPTDTKPSRIVATTANGQRVTVSYDNASRNPHRDAALALCKKVGWTGTLAEGGTKEGSVFVFVDDQSSFQVESNA